MSLPLTRDEATRRITDTGLMKDELSHALVEALFELEVLPHDEDGTLLGLYAVMDDLQDAIRRTEALDRPCRR